MSDFRVVRGIGDVAGEAAGCGLLGYGNVEQQSAGVHLRLRARAFVIVVVDVPLIFDSIHREVPSRLRAEYGDLYLDENVMLTSTHTHCGPKELPRCRARNDPLRRIPVPPSCAASSSCAGHDRSRCQARSTVADHREHLERAGSSIAALLRGSQDRVDGSASGHLGRDGLNITVLTYCGRIEIGIVADRDQMPDVQLIATCMTEELNELVKVTVGQPA